MSYTQNEMVSLDVLEDAVNVVARAFFTQRSRYLVLDSNAPTSPTSTNVAPIQVGFLTVHWAVASPIPTVDLHQAEAAWPIPAGAPSFALDEFGVLADPVKVFVNVLGGITDVVRIAFTGKAQLVTTFPYAIHFHFHSAAAQVLPTQNTQPLTLSLLPALSNGLQQFLQGLTPVTIPLPPIAVGPIVPASGPIIDQDIFGIKGSP